MNITFFLHNYRYLTDKVKSRDGFKLVYEKVNISLHQTFTSKECIKCSIVRNDFNSHFCFTKLSTFRDLNAKYALRTYFALFLYAYRCILSGESNILDKFKLQTGSISIVHKRIPSKLHSLISIYLLLSLTFKTDFTLCYLLLCSVTARVSERLFLVSTAQYTSDGR